MRNTTQRAIFILVVCVAGGLLLNIVTAYAAETLTVTRDHFEFRDSPKVAEETLIGTLRAGTDVEWTGTVSGDWFEVRGPGNQVGWIHKSGVSTPKAAPTSQQKPAAASAGTSSRSTSTRSPSTSTLQKQIAELEKDNALYKALLDEKELRVTELSGEIEELEQKLLDMAQNVSDTQQMREMQQAQVTDMKAQIAELNAALEQKETELRKNNIELTKLQAQADRARPQGNLLVYGVYGMLGLLVFLLLSVVVWYIRRNRSANKVVSPPPNRRPEHLHSVTSERPGEPTEQSEPVIPALSSPPDNAYLNEDVEELEEIEDVEIELSDVLPATDLDSPGSEETLEEVKDIEIVSESDLDIIDDIDVLDQIDEVAGDIDVIEEIEAIEEHDVIEGINRVEDIDVVEDIATVEEIDTIEEAGVLEAIDEIDDIEAFDEIGDSDDIEVLDAPDDIEASSGRLENVLFNAPDDVSIYEELEEREEHLDIFDDEEIGNDADFEFDSVHEYEAEPLKGAADAEAEIEEPASEPVDIGGETYEMLVEQSTQIIEADDDLEEEVLMAPKAFEDVPYVEPENLPTLKEEIEELSDLLEAREIELEEIHDYDGYDDYDSDESADDVIDEELDDLMADLDDGQVQGVEIEEIEVVEDTDELDDFDEIEVIGDLDDTVFEAEGESAFESVESEYPDLLEPSPLLIEPEYEPADVTLSAPAESEAATASDESAANGPIYEIELVRVGNNTEQIIEFLSKVKGLPKSPEELVRTVPTIITHDAKETDAQNFQILMQKLGATVRVVKQ